MKSMSREGKTTESMHWRIQRMWCWLKAMRAQIDDLLAEALAGVIVRGSGLRACHVKASNKWQVTGGK
jgi:hypothetical protein